MKTLTHEDRSSPAGEREGTTVPFEIAYENMEASPAAEVHVLRGIRRLEKVAPDLVSVRVTLARRNPRRRTGDLYDVNLHLSLPGPDVVVSRTPTPHHEDEDLVLAIGEAFEKARRKVVEQHAVERGDVKQHDASLKGTVSDLFPDYGFIRGADGRIVYFHRNSVPDGEWDRFELGDRVLFADEPGEEGPHATTVTKT